MLDKTKGIVFRTVKYRETSLIIDIFTLNFGFRTFIINGVRKPKARFHASLFQIGTILDLEIYFQNNKEINRIKEVRIDYIYTSIPFNIVKSSVLLFCVEVLTKSVKESDENKKLFSFITSFFIYLDQSEKSISNLPNWFLIHLSAYIGFRPALNHGSTYFDLKEGRFSDEIPTHSNFLKPPFTEKLMELLVCELKNVSEIRTNSKERTHLLDKMVDYYRFHVENFKVPKSIEILSEVFR